MADTAGAIACKPAFMKIVVPDAEASVGFYTDVLGLVRDRTIDLPSILEIILTEPGGGFEVTIVSYRRPMEIVAGRNWGPIGFETDDLDGLLARMLAAGAQVVVPAGTLDDLRYVIVSSPDGHEIELIERIAA